MSILIPYPPHEVDVRCPHIVFNHSYTHTFNHVHTCIFYRGMYIHVRCNLYRYMLIYTPTNIMRLHHDFGHSQRSYIMATVQIAVPQRSIGMLVQTYPTVTSHRSSATDGSSRCKRNHIMYHIQKSLSTIQYEYSKESSHCRTSQLARQHHL